MFFNTSTFVENKVIQKCPPIPVTAFGQSMAVCYSEEGDRNSVTKGPVTGSSANCRQGGGASKGLCASLSCGLRAAGLRAAIAPTAPVGARYAPPAAAIKSAHFQGPLPCGLTSCKGRAKRPCGAGRAGQPSAAAGTGAPKQERVCCCRGATDHRSVLRQ